MRERLLESMVSAPPPHLADGIRALDADYERVNADAVALLHFSGVDGVGTDPASIGPIIPPYDQLWIDATVDHEGLSVRVGMSVTRYECDCCEAGERHYRVIFFADPTPGFVMNRFITFSVDQRGMWTGHKFFEDPWEQRPIDTGEPLNELLLPVLWTALGLMNCRNVNLREAAPSLTRQQRRNARVVRYSYKVIELPRPSQRTMQECAGAQPSLTALHRVRGHFKTFTEDAPLLGKHVGTYWWGWQTRGAIEQGVSLHDYKVGASA